MSSDDGDVKPDHNDDSATPKFSMEKFSLILASNLVGKEVLEERFRQDRIEFSLQWQSPILMKIEWKNLQKMTTKTAEKNTAASDHTLDVVLVNGTFLFHSSGVSLQFGAMTHKLGQFFYTQGSPITYQYMDHHVDQQSVVLEDTESKLIAQDMAEELSHFQTSTTVQQQGDGVVKIPMKEQDGDTIYLIIQPEKKEEQTFLDPSVVSLILSAADSNYKPVASPKPGTETDKDDFKVLFTQYCQWKERATELIQEAEEENTTTDMIASPQKIESSPAKSSSVASSPAKDTPKGKKKSKAKPMRAGYMRISNKKKSTKGMFGAKK